MKNLRLTLLGIIFGFGALFSSCKKEEPLETVEQETNPIVTDTTNNSTQSGGVVLDDFVKIHFICVTDSAKITQPIINNQFGSSIDNKWVYYGECGNQYNATFNGNLSLQNNSNLEIFFLLGSYNFNFKLERNNDDIVLEEMDNTYDVEICEIFNDKIILLLHNEGN